MGIPNLISLARLISVPLIVWLILVDQMLAAFLVFVGAGLSDAVDGYLAKRLGAESEMGRYLDPVADKALLAGVYVTLGIQEFLPAWLVILVVFRDLLIVGGAVLQLLVFQNLIITPLFVSKANTAAQITLAAVVLGERGLTLDLGPTSLALIMVVAITTLLSGSAYLVYWGRGSVPREGS